MGLRGLLDEAVAKDDADLRTILQGYDAILKKDSSVVVSCNDQNEAC